MSRYPRAIAGRGGFHLTKGMVIPPFNTRAFPQPIFDLPLKTSIIPRSGGAVPTFTRATVATFDDWEQVVRTAIAGEARFSGARRIQNLLTNTVFAGGNVPTGWNELAGGGTVKAVPSNIDNLHNRLDFFVNNQREIIGFTVNLVIGRTYRISVFCEAFTPGTVTLTDNSLHAVAATATFTGVPNVQTTKFIAGKRMCGDLITCTASGTATFRIGLGCAANEPGNGTISLSHPQIEDVTGQSNQAPGEYVSVGALAAPYHGANVDGVKYFDYQNLNSVINGNIVSTSTGAPVALPNCMYWSEGQRTNICLQSESFNTTWILEQILAFGAGSVIDATTAPDGNVTADKITEDASVGSAHRMSQNIVIAANATLAISCFVKRAVGARQFCLTSQAGANNFRAYFDLTNGVVGTADAAGDGSIVTSKIVPYPNGWYRCIAVGITSAATANSSLKAGLSSGTTAGTDGYTGDGVSGNYVWGYQAELGSFASTYIPTVAATVTRNADALTYPGAGSINNANGACYAELSNLDPGAAQQKVAIGSDSAASSGPLQVVFGSAVTTICAFDSVNQISKGGLSNLTANIGKRASSWGNGISVTGDGLAVTTGAFDGSMGNGTTIGIGCSGAGTSQWFGGIRNVRIWDRQISDAQLQACTQAAFTEFG